MSEDQALSEAKRKGLPGYVPAPPTTVDAPLTQSGALRRPLGSFTVETVARDRLTYNGSAFLQRRLVNLVACRVICVLPSRFQINPPPVVIAAVVFHFINSLRVRLERLWDWHCFSPARWLRANTILSHWILWTNENGPFRNYKPRNCNTKINNLTTFHTFVQECS